MDITWLGVGGILEGLEGSLKLLVEVWIHVADVVEDCPRDVGHHVYGQAGYDLCLRACVLETWSMIEEMNE